MDLALALALHVAARRRIGGDALLGRDELLVRDVLEHQDAAHRHALLQVAGTGRRGGSRRAAARR